MADWISGNFYLSQSERDNNAKCIWDALGGLYGWSFNAVCAVLGNYDKESTLNPGIWQGLNEGNTSGGLGLGQWTPATKLLNWASENGYNWEDGDAQCLLLTENSGQWHETNRPGPPQPSPVISWEEFKKSDLDIQTLTTYFYWWWEDPSYSDTTLPGRLESAAYYYTLLSGEDPDPGPGPGPGPGPSPETKHFKWWIYMRRF